MVVPPARGSALALLLLLPASGKILHPPLAHLQIHAQMNPARVAKLIDDTEREWVELYNSKDRTAQSQMIESCRPIVEAVATSSDGDKDRVESYFAEVGSSTVEGGTSVDVSARTCHHVFHHRVSRYSLRGSSSPY